MNILTGMKMKDNPMSELLIDHKEIEDKLKRYVDENGGSLYKTIRLTLSELFPILNLNAELWRYCTSELLKPHQEEKLMKHKERLLNEQS